MLRLALFLCPTLVMNLRAGAATHTPDFLADRLRHCSDGRLSARTRAAMSSPTSSTPSIPLCRIDAERAAAMKLVNVEDARPAARAPAATAHHVRLYRRRRLRRGDAARQSPRFRALERCASRCWSMSRSATSPPASSVRTMPCPSCSARSASSGSMPGTAKCAAARPPMPPACRCASRPSPSPRWPSFDTRPAACCTSSSMC